MTSNFKERLNEAFRFCNYSQKELADMIGISKALMNQYIKGLSSPKDISKVVALAKIFNVNPAWLAGYDVPREEFKIDDNEIKLLKKLRLLNNDGLEKTESYIDDLLESPKYQKSEIAERDKKLA